MNQRYLSWSSSRRVSTALARVLDDGWSQTKAAEEFGISRSHLNRRVKAAREAAAAKTQRVDEVRVVDPAGQFVQETRRLPETLTEFMDTYFTNWMCPDCEVRHEVPDFHEEIWAATHDPDSRRLVINLPPYHSKSTVVSVWDTVHKTVANPNMRTAIVSSTENFASAFLSSIRKILGDDDLYHESRRNLIDDFGPFVPTGDSWSNTELRVEGRTGAEKDPTVMALGIGTQVYGRRFDEIKFDDVAIVKNQRNPVLVANMLSMIDKEHMSRVGKRGKVIFVGTRIMPGDIYSTLVKRDGYTVIRYPLILDEESESVLWEEHFPWSQAMIARSEMTPADFQLVYQNVDVPGAGASFTQEMVDRSKDPSRPLGSYDSRWRLIAGLDPAGGGKDSGYTAFSLIGVDLMTAKRYLIDQVAVKSMKAPQIMDQIKSWSTDYPVAEWRVESNGLQSQLVQYNLEISQWLASRGIRVVPHHTHGNKWDPHFGVETIAPLMAADMLSLPWSGQAAQRTSQAFIDEMLAFPMGVTSDRLMSFWFAELGVREALRTLSLPMFDSRLKVPGRVRRRRGVASFERRDVRGVPISAQREGEMRRQGYGGQQAVVGAPVPQHLLGQGPMPRPTDDEDGPAKFSNIDYDAIWGGEVEPPWEG